MPASGEGRCRSAPPPLLGVLMIYLVVYMIIWMMIIILLCHIMHIPVEF